MKQQQWFSPAVGCKMSKRRGWIGSDDANIRERTTNSWAVPHTGSYTGLRMDSNGCGRVMPQLKVGER